MFSMVTCYISDSERIYSQQGEGFWKNEGNLDERNQKKTYKELEDEVSRNHTEMLTAGRDHKRELIRRDHELMTEMDSRWEPAKSGNKKHKNSGERDFRGSPFFVLILVEEGSNHGTFIRNL